MSRLETPGEVPGLDIPRPRFQSAFMRTLLGLLLAVAHAALAQPPSATGGFLVRTWQSEDGLPGNVVRSIVQAPDGYLWVATAEGLVRFNGRGFDPYEADSDGGQRVRFSYARLFATPDNTIWVTTYDAELFRVASGRLVRVLEGVPRPASPFISQLLGDKEGTVHLKRGEEYWRIENGHEPTLIDPDERLLAQFEKDRIERTTRGRALDRQANPNLIDRSGRRWQTDPRGVLVVSSPEGEEQRVEILGVGPGFACNEFLEDREGNIWLATGVHGLVRVRESRVDALKSANGLSDPTILALLQDSEGRWWLGNRSGGIDRWTLDGVEHLELVPGKVYRPVASLFEDSRHRLWVGSRGGSLFLFNNDRFVPQFSRTQVPSKVMAMAEDPSGNLWFGGSQGLSWFDEVEVHPMTTQDGVPATEFCTLATSPWGEILAGSIDGRVVAGSPAGFRQLGGEDDLARRRVSSIHPVSENEIWVGTLGAGLLLWRDQQWHRFTTSDGLPDGRITSIVPDSKGHLWFGTLAGIVRVDRRDLLKCARNRTHPVRWLTLDRSDGLPSRECIGGFQPAGWRGSDDHLWFPTSAGIARINSELVDINSTPPPVFIESVAADGQALDPTNAVTGPGRTRLEFRFAGLSYSAPEKVTYRARLTGLDKDWHTVSGQHHSVYEAVPPGRYTFEVVAVSGDGIRTPVPARIDLHVQAHFWESWWFVLSLSCLILLLAAGIGWLSARQRMRRRMQALQIRSAREGERARIAQDLHDDLGASLTEVSILAALASEDGNESAVRGAMRELSLKAKNAVGALDEIVWAVNPREDSLRSLVDYLAAFGRDFLRSANISFRTDIPKVIPQVRLNSKIRHGVFMAAKEALNNLVKHSRATEARLSVRFDETHLEIEIADNGRGLSPATEGTGYGMGNLQERMNACDGTCSVSNLPEGGLSVHLSLPIPENPPR